MLFNDLELIPGTLRNHPDLGEVSHLLQFGTSLTRAGGQDDVSFDKLSQIDSGLAGGVPWINTELVRV